jgi:hypothetical protein
MKKMTLEEKVKMARESKFSMPREVSCQKTFLPEGMWAYVFRHTQWGELGRLLILPHPSGQTQFTCEVAGDPNDPITMKRREILEPITKGMLEKMNMICGKGSGDPQAYSLSKEKHVIKSDVMPCEKCGAPTAMLILAEDAVTTDRLEDYARLMYEKIKELDVHTWVIGAEKEVFTNGDFAGESLALKVWPSREQAKVILSTDLNLQLDVLMQKHCRS